MITIYHNPRCTKSRECLFALEKINKPFKIRTYLTEPFSVAELKEVIHKLGIKPLELVRKKEAIWISNFKDKQLSDIDIIAALLAHPKLIERPIVVLGNKAVIARPLDKINVLDL